MQIPEKGYVFRSSPTGWTMTHTLFLWAFASAATWIYYFIVTPLLDWLPPIAAWAWAPAAVVALKLALSIGPSLPMARVLKLLLLYVVALVSLHLIGARLLAWPTPREWLVSMLASGCLVVLLESVHAFRRRNDGYAVGLFPDRFEFEEPGKLKSWPWKSTSVFWDAKTREFVVTGPGTQEVRLKPDLPGRRQVVRVIEAVSGRPCRELA